MQSIEEELRWWHAELTQQNKLIEAQRLWQRTMFDLEMIKQIGYCHGIENYSRHFSGRMPGEAPPTLLDYLPHDAILFIDESHQTIPQLQGMYHGDRSRKDVLVNYGFRLPSARDNRPLTFEEFEHRVNQVIYVSATPGPYELTKSAGVVVEQIIRPTGLTDPEIEIRPIKGQVDNLLHEIRDRAEKNERVLVTTLTKRMAEDLVRVLQRSGRALRIYAFGGEHARSREDPPRSSPRHLRCADRREPAARRPGSSGSFSGRDSGCGQRRLSAVDGVADSDDRPRRPQPERPRDSLRRCDDGEYEAGDRRNHAPARRSSRSTTKRTTSRRNRSSSRWIWRLVAIAEADYVTVPVEPESPEEELTPEQREQMLKELEENMKEAARKFEFEKAAQIRDRLKAIKARIIHEQTASSGTSVLGAG